MPQKKIKRAKKSFFRIKERLVLVQPKKFIGRRLLGVILVLLGTFTLSISITYFFLAPRIIKREPKTAQIIVEPFAPTRMLVPSINLDLLISESNLIGKVPSSLSLGLGTEILILGKDNFKKYKITQTQINSTGVTNSILLENEGQIVRFNLVLKQKPLQAIEVTGELEK